MRIAVLGAGGVGAYFGGRWAEAGLDVTLIARGDHLRALREAGLRIESPLGSATLPIRAAAPGEATGPFDVIVVATRVWQLDSVTDELRRLAGPDGLIMGVQNGVESADRLSAAVGRHNVLGATCRIISMLDGPGLIRHMGADPVLTFGEQDGGSSERTAWLERQLNLGTLLRVVASDNVSAEIWQKFLFLATVSGFGSVTRLPIGYFRNVPESRRLLIEGMGEVQRVSRAHGVELPAGSVEKAVAFVDALPESATTSMQRDFDAGRVTELEALSGAVVRLGRRHGIATPVHDFVYSALLPMHRRAERPVRAAD